MTSVDTITQWRDDWSSASVVTHPFNGLVSGTTRVSRYQKGKTNLDCTEARDSEWRWHQLGHMQICTSLQTNNHASTPPLSFLQAGCPSCRPTNSVKALKAKALKATTLFVKIIDPIIRQPGFNLPRHTWSLMNRFRTGKGPCRADLHKWGLAKSPSCVCDQRQTMIHIVNTCPLTKFEE